MHIVNKHGGKLPISIKAVPEGTVCVCVCVCAYASHAMHTHPCAGCAVQERAYDGREHGPRVLLAHELPRDLARPGELSTSTPKPGLPCDLFSA